MKVPARALAVCLAVAAGSTLAPLAHAQPVDYFGTLRFVITTAVKSKIGTADIRCRVTVYAGDSTRDPYSGLWVDEHYYTQAKEVNATRDGSSARCIVDLPYRWTLSGSSAAWRRQIDVYTVSTAPEVTTSVSTGILPLLGRSQPLTMPANNLVTRMNFSRTL